MSTSPTPAPAEKPPLTFTGRIGMAFVLGVPFAALMCFTGWLSAVLRRSGVRGKYGRGFRSFPLEYAIGITTGILCCFVLLGALWPLGKSRWVSIPLCTLVFFASLVTGFWAAGELALPPAGGVAALTGEFNVLMSALLAAVFGPLAGLAMAGMHAAPAAPARPQAG